VEEVKRERERGRFPKEPKELSSTPRRDVEKENKRSCFADTAVIPPVFSQINTGRSQWG